MTIMEAISLIIAAIVVPYLVALIRNKAITGSKARWLAIGASVLAGIAAALVGGIPATPAALIACIFTAIGAVQVAYAAFRSVGVTSRLLDALMDLGHGETPAQAAKEQSLADHAERRIEHD